MKTIRLAGVSVASGRCEEPSGEVPKLNLPLVRRDFLKGTGVLIGTLASGSLLAALAPSTVWAVELKALSQTEGETLMKMGRTLYPHDKLPDAVYALLAKDLDAKAAGDVASATLLHDGIEALDKAAGGSFARASAAERLRIVKAMATVPKTIDDYSIHQNVTSPKSSAEQFC